MNDLEKFYHKLFFIDYADIDLIWNKCNEAVEIYHRKCVDYDKTPTYEHFLEEVWKIHDGNRTRNSIWHYDLLELAYDDKDDICIIRSDVDECFNFISEREQDKIFSALRKAYDTY